MDTKEKKFIEQSSIFLEKLLLQKGYNSLNSVENITNRLVFPLIPVIVRDFNCLKQEEIDSIVDNYNKYGVAYFICESPQFNTITELNPIFILTRQLEGRINFEYPLIHPLEKHKEIKERFGKEDETVKVYNLPKTDNNYKEVAETNMSFEVHSDGLGSGNTVENFILYCESAPLFGGFTFFYDLLSLGLCLAKEDFEAFQRLFLPTAITAIRPRGKGSIKVTSPIFYLDDSNSPNAFFRRNSGEYEMHWYQGDVAFDRGLEFLMNYTSPFSNGSYFVNFSNKGHGIIAKNLGYAHGRTEFIDGESTERKRVLSRKWFMKNAFNQDYKHVPGIFVSKEYAELYPEYFGSELLQGEWNYDSISNTNYRVS